MMYKPTPDGNCACLTACSKRKSRMKLSCGPSASTIRKDSGQASVEVHMKRVIGLGGVFFKGQCLEQQLVFRQPLHKYPHHVFSHNQPYFCFRQSFVQTPFVHQAPSAHLELY